MFQSWRGAAQELGSAIVYKATVDHILTEGQGADAHATGVRLRDGTELRANCVISNATRWDTFGRLVPFVPENEAKFRKRYVKSPSFLTVHLGIKADVLPVRFFVVSKRMCFLCFFVASCKQQVPCCKKLDSKVCRLTLVP